MRVFVAVSLLSLAVPAVAEGTRSSGEVVAAHIVSSVGDDAATDAPKRARKDEKVTLYAVVEVREGKKRRLFSDAASFTLGGKKETAAPLAEAPVHFFVWNTIEPTSESMSNTTSGSFKFEPVEYATSLVLAGLGKSSLPADVRPTLTTDRGDGVGTMRYQLGVISGQGAFETPGVGARKGRGSGGLADSIHRVTVRRDDTYLGVLTELYGQPYIWASAGRTDKSHQSERLEGSDCADFVVYGWRRLGADIPYTWTGQLPDYTRLLARGSADEDGIYRDEDGAPIAYPKDGDLVLFPRHVGALAADKGEIGVLDHADIMMHSYFASPREQAIGDSDYARTWLEVRRWK